ncbi:MAG TPA: glycosyltransferase family 39 protein [Acidimicrobiales bacterium]|nr:glycosyltransferase family 39 protein [Acidimicrobiales bacterium]
MTVAPAQASSPRPRDDEARPRPYLSVLLDSARRHRALLAVLGAFLLSTLVVPTSTNIPSNDDWVYARSVELLVREHRLEIIDLSVATLVFQVLWGGLFASLLGMSFVALRISTLVLVALASWALYGLCRELGVSKRRSALGAAVYLFNPLGFTMSFTFMTDPHFTALLVISTFLYVKGLHRRSSATGFVLAGSVAASCAFLVRQGGVLLPLAVVATLVLTRKARSLRQGAVMAMAAVAVPLATVVAYYLWLHNVNGVPAMQENFLGAWKAAGWSGTKMQVRRLGFIGLMYVGFFTLPVVAGALARPRQLLAVHGWGARALVAAWSVVVVGGLFHWRYRTRFPYLPQFVSRRGLGPDDILLARPAILDRADQHVLTALIAVAAIGAGFAVCRSLDQRPSAGPGLVLVVCVAVTQAAAVLPGSFVFINWYSEGYLTPGTDRYLLPLLPLVVCLVLAGLREVRLSRPLAAATLAVVAAVSVAGTRDSLVFQRTIWETAEATARSGVPRWKIDGGAPWDGYHLWEYSVTEQIPVQTEGVAWWLYVFAPASDSTYVVAGAPLDGYDVLRTIPYSSWLQTRPTNLYLQHKRPVPAP